MSLKCDKCGESTIKRGKLTGVAAIQSLDSKTGLGESEVLIDFCSKCGKVIEMTVENPDKIK